MQVARRLEVSENHLEGELLTLFLLSNNWWKLSLHFKTFNPTKKVKLCGRVFSLCVSIQIFTRTHFSRCLVPCTTFDCI
jgi:hypothetical protein